MIYPVLLCSFALFAIKKVHLDRAVNIEIILYKIWAKATLGKTGID